MRHWGILGSVAAGLLAPAWVAAVDMPQGFVPLTPDKPYLHVVHQGRSVKVQRVQDRDYVLKGYFARTVRECPPFCLQPMSVAPGVAVIGEVELFEFMETALRDGSGVLIDARTPGWYRKGTIPGSANYPFTLFDKPAGDTGLERLLEGFGAVRRGELGLLDRTLEEWGLVDTAMKTPQWDFTAAKRLVLWCNGPACGQSPRAIRGLLAAGYPAGKILYYRGGMQQWQLWGLTTVIPE